MNLISVVVLFQELQLYNRPKKPPNSFNLFVRAARLQLGKAEPPVCNALKRFLFLVVDQY